MTRGLIGKKLGMTQIFDDMGNQIPVTVVQAGPCPVLDVRTPDRNGYSAVALGFDKKELDRANRPAQGYFSKVGDSAYRVVREIRVDDSRIGEFSLGQIINVEQFKVGDNITVTGRSKGKGFTGVMKRWGFGGGRKTHGSRFHRAPGAIGMCAWPARTFKGRKMPGHKGTERVTVKNLSVVDVFPERNVLLIKGAVPGSKNGILIIRGAN